MFEELRKIIEAHDTIVIFGHAYPDGDCYGSQIGLRDVLRLNYPKKKVYAVGTGCKRFFNLISPTDIVEDSVIENALAVLVDGNDLSRMEDKRIYNAKAYIKIDHHMENGKYHEGPFVLDVNANSTCQLIVRFIKESKWKITKTAANALYLGILTDTGRFQFAGDYVESFQEVAWLCECGADPDAINSILTVTVEDALAFKGYVFSHYKKSPSGVLYVTFNRSQLERFHVSAHKAGEMVNLLANVKDYPIWASFAENPNGSMHAEFRSNGPGVYAVAAKYGGGGHYQASGVTLHHMNSKNVKMLVDDLDAVALEYKKEHQ